MVERAEKDVAIESLLNTFEEVWLSRQLELKTHIRAGRHEVGLNCFSSRLSTALGGLGVKAMNPNQGSKGEVGEKGGGGGGGGEGRSG